MVRKRQLSPLKGKELSRRTALVLDGSIISKALHQNVLSETGHGLNDWQTVVGLRLRSTCNEVPSP
jgi:hypothetical protein